MATMWPLRRWTMEGRRAGKDRKNLCKMFHTISVSLQIKAALLTLCQGNRPKIISFHNVPLNGNVGVQYGATVTDSRVIDEDVHVAVTFEDLLCSSVHRVSVSQVEGNSNGSVSLRQKNTKEHLLNVTVLPL